MNQEERTGSRVLTGARNVLDGFRGFLMRGNVVELAVAVVIGAAFTNIVNAVVDGVISPLVGAFGTQNLDAYQLCLRGACAQGDGVTISWGAVLSASLTFLITAAVVYFLMILPMTRYLERRKAKEPAEAAALTDVELLAQIRDELVALRAASTGSPGLVAAQRSAPGEGGGPAPAGSGDGSDLADEE
ncbi:large conductance mechanosensitive channel protein MscL [Streptomyces sp. DSM 44915]|uniref:Large-conductance mechanosensitive channel n=1 Tax=Streptomyces chisholmiae TaxID=3075540 RepID=A0ABU2JTE5_9ACTN|nr:large conductance mechanosensitive channel protein MscL [Streptomyces sp. DSM 44915]MDT0268263.1 large conductance mechanosensitive channel protein MscL [Streptomyces sp. DSM 44915]